MYNLSLFFAKDPLTFKKPFLVQSGKPGQKETVTAGRRRHTGSDSPGERPRADAPRRQTGQSGGGAPGGGAPRPPFTSGGSGRPAKPLSIGAIILFALCAIVVMVLQGGGSDEISDLPAATIERRPTNTPVGLSAGGSNAGAPATATRPRPTSVPGSGSRWLVMLYQDADDKILEEDIFLDLNEAERVGSSDQVQIVAQLDRFNGGYQGDGNWSSTRRYFITQDNDLNRIGSQLIADLGEVNMADNQTLIDFVDWAVENYPADKYVLILSDHGMGWPGGWSDPDPAGNNEGRIPLASRLGNHLFLHELDETLSEIQSKTGVQQFELIGLDACLMAQIEVFTALAPYARYAVASQEVEPALGWAYTDFLSALVNNPAMDGHELANTIVDGYIQSDQRVVDDIARAEFMRQGSPMGSLFNPMSISPQQLTQQLSQRITLSAIDLTQMPQVIGDLNNLAAAMRQVAGKDIARARSYSQSFTSIFGENVPPSYIDLSHFIQLLKTNRTEANLLTAIDRLQTSLERAVIAQKNGPKLPGARGMAIYFPNSTLYASPMAGPQSYTAIADRFAQQSLWDEFLAYHYVGQNFEPNQTGVAAPVSSGATRAPGKGSLQVGPLTLSSPRAAPGRPITLSTDILGENIGHIYLFVGYYDSLANSINVTDMDYLESQDTRQLNGVYYPVWPEGREFTLQFEWDPVVFAIHDGFQSALAMFKPQSYGASFELATYTVDGIYTFADSGDQRYARLVFSNGELRQVLGFSGDSASPEIAGAPREIIPQVGDRFTVLEKWLDLEADGSVRETNYQQGKTLTFGAQGLRWQELSPAVGAYIIGLLVEDLDGNITPVYAQVQVE
jgi:hypothetical protein